MVVLDSDLAALYGVKTARLNQQVRRNADRFPDDFAFTLTTEEKREVVANCNNPRKVLYFRGLPMVYTEHGALMAATVLNSPVAARMGIFMVRAFVKMRREMAGQDRFSRKLAEIGPRAPTPGPCQSRLRPLKGCAYAPALIRPYWFTMKGYGTFIRS
jgi:hypothetical protein